MHCDEQVLTSEMRCTNKINVLAVTGNDINCQRGGHIIGIATCPADQANARAVNKDNNYKNHKIKYFQQLPHNSWHNIHQYHVHLHTVL